MSPAPTTSSCTFCRCRFPTSDITQWTDTGSTPLCPRCAVHAVLGDIGSMQALASRLSVIGTAEVTPWGLTLRAPDGRDLAMIDVWGKGTFNAAVVLTEGFGARAAKKLTASVLAWFERKVAPEWRAQGFTKPRSGPAIEFSVDGVTHRAVTLDLSFEVQADVVAKLRWAGARNLLAFPGGEHVPTRRPKPVEVDRSKAAATEFFMALTHEGLEARAGLREWFVNNTDDFASVRSRLSAWIDTHEQFSIDSDGRPEWAALGDVPPRSAIILMDGLRARLDLVHSYTFEITRLSGVMVCYISVFADAQDYQTLEQLPILDRDGYAFPPSRTDVPYDPAAPVFSLRAR